MTFRGHGAKKGKKKKEDFETVFDVSRWPTFTFFLSSSGALPLWRKVCFLDLPLSEDD